MTNDSKLFDSIRIKSRRGEKAKTEQVMCEWDGCDKPGTYRAPKRKSEEGGFHNYCLEHVRQYNKNFDYFDGMEKDKLDEMLRTNTKTGERPTWDMGSNPNARNAGQRGGVKRPRSFAQKRVSDPLNLFARAARNQGRRPMTERERNLLEVDKRAIETLGLEGRPKSDDIKTAYKTLVKKHHPDANGGDRASEDRLRAIITAYNHLKQKGFV